MENRDTGNQRAKPKHQCDLADVVTPIIESYLNPPNPIYEIVYVDGYGIHNLATDRVLVQLKLHRELVELVDNFTRDIPMINYLGSLRSYILFTHLEEDKEINADGLLLIQRHLDNGQQIRRTEPSDVVQFVSCKRIS
jgi:hypothetical protein